MSVWKIDFIERYVQYAMRYFWIQCMFHHAAIVSVEDALQVGWNQAITVQYAERLSIYPFGFPSISHSTHHLIASKRRDFPFRNALILTEIIDELKVHCQYGVKAKAPGSSLRFGVVGSDFLEITDGCKAVFAVKGILFVCISTLMHWFRYEEAWGKVSIWTE